MPRNIF